MTQRQQRKDVNTLKAEMGIETIKDFGKYFKHFSFINGCFEKQANWETRGPLLCTLQAAFESLRALEKTRKRAEQALADNTERPLDTAIHRSLIEKWKKAHGFPLHPFQEYTSQLLNGSYRALRKRIGKAMPVKGLYTLEDTNHTGEAREAAEAEHELRYHRQDRPGR